MVRRAVALVLSLLIFSASAAAFAQPAAKTYRIGWLGISTPARPEHFFALEAFQGSLREHGFVVGRNVTMVERYADGRSERYSEFAAELAGMRVDLIVAMDSAGAHAAKNATRTIPIVLGNPTNPERQGLVASLARPGGNITGMSQMGADFSGKMLQILKETLPKISRVAILFNPENPGSALALKESDIPAKTLGITAIPIEVRAPGDLERAFQSVLRESVDALYPHLAMWPYREQISELAAKHGLPIIVSARHWPQLGVLVSYGVDLQDQYRRVGLYVVRILKGAKPGDLPVEQPTKFELVVNLRTAKALGLSISRSLLLRADQVIE